MLPDAVSLVADAAQVQPHAGLAGLVVRPVAFVAVSREDRADILVEVRPGGAGGDRRDGYEEPYQPEAQARVQIYALDVSFLALQPSG